ncbi:MAG: hypothetical protein ACERIH_05100 [Labilibaculum antarcticum]
MKDLFITGGSFFMGLLTLLLIITVAWIIYHFILAYRSKQTEKVISLRKLAYGKSLGLFALFTGVLGQMFGFCGMFDATERFTAIGKEISPHMIFGALKTTVIVTIYGSFIYLFSILLWFVASILIEKKKAYKGVV